VCQRARWGDNKQGHEPRAGEFGSVLRQQADVARATADLWPAIAREDTSPVCSVNLALSIGWERHCPTAVVDGCRVLLDTDSGARARPPCPMPRSEAMDGRTEAWRWRLGKRTSQVDSRHTAFHGTNGLRDRPPAERRKQWRHLAVALLHMPPRNCGRILGVGPNSVHVGELVTAPATRASLNGWFMSQLTSMPDPRLGFA
jgi:hypothetical protein